MKASYLLRENIEELLRLRHLDGASLARAVGHEKAWINKILRGSRQMSVTDLDAVADVLGVATYQLFQPGIARRAERRSVTDRRSNQERRISQAHRQMQMLAAELAEVRKVLRPPKPPGVR